jgi:hypothetical protein
MDWKTHIAEQVQRFVKLGQIPGAKDYAWAREGNGSTGAGVVRGTAGACQAGGTQ